MIFIGLNWNSFNFIRQNNPYKLVILPISRLGPIILHFSQNVKYSLFCEDIKNHREIDGNPRKTQLIYPLYMTINLYFYY